MHYPWSTTKNYFLGLEIVKFKKNKDLLLLSIFEGGGRQLLSERGKFCTIYGTSSFLKVKTAQITFYFFIRKVFYVTITIIKRQVADLSKSKISVKILKVFKNYVRVTICLVLCPSKYNEKRALIPYLFK